MKIVSIGIMVSIVLLHHTQTKLPRGKLAKEKYKGWKFTMND